MRHPALIVNKEKLYNNIKVIMNLCHGSDIDICAVTKVFCAHPAIVEVFVEAGIKTLADSRLQNLKKISHVNVEKMLLRMPMLSEAEDVI